MSLYQFGCKLSSAENSGSSNDIGVPHCMPSLGEAKTLGLGEVDFE